MIVENPLFPGSDVLDKKYKQHNLNMSILSAWISDNFNSCSYQAFYINSDILFHYSCSVMNENVNIRAMYEGNEFDRRTFQMSQITANLPKFKSDLLEMEANAVMNVNAFKSVKDSELKLVDMGLPSGLKWTTVNVGSDKPNKLGTKYLSYDIDAIIAEFNAEHHLNCRLPSVEDYNELFRHTTLFSNDDTLRFINLKAHQCIAFHNFKIKPFPLSLPQSQRSFFSSSFGNYYHVSTRSNSPVFQNRYAIRLVSD